MINLTRHQVLWLGLAVGAIAVIFLVLLLLPWFQPAPSVPTALSEPAATKEDVIATTSAPEATKEDVPATISDLKAKVGTLDHNQQAQAKKIVGLEAEVFKSPTPTHTPTATATHTPTTTPTPSASLPPGPVCVQGGNCYTTIKEAVREASDGDTIVIGIGIYTDNVLIDKSLTLNGNPGGGTIVDGDDADVVFMIASNKSVVMNDLSIMNGRPGIVNQGGDLTLRRVIVTDNECDSATLHTSINATEKTTGGGGIFNRSGSLILIDTTISENKSADSFKSEGGGIFMLTGVLTVSSSAISHNQADRGGGIYLDNAAATIANSTINNNTIDGQNPLGGGIFLNLGAQVTITKSTIYDNVGGGIYNSGVLLISTSTISGNQTTGFGGGIYVAGGTTTLTDSTISGNQAEGGGGGIYHTSGFNRTAILNSTITRNKGSGIFAVLGYLINTSTISLTSTIVADNEVWEGATGAADCTGAIISRGYNLIQHLDADCRKGLMESDKREEPALLRPLANNGGPTFTHALRLVSPAIDMGGRDCPATDQRGRARTDGQCDIGAFEWKPGD